MKIKNVYLDYSATTPIKDEVLNAMMPYLKENYGNPSSIYSLGVKNKKAIQYARKQVADLIKANPEEIYFTSGGSESDNWVIKGVGEYCNDIITTNIEHKAILNSVAKSMTNSHYINVDKEGFINVDNLKQAINSCEPPFVVSVMLINNEVGTIQNIKEIAKIVHDAGGIFHTDAVQAVGNINIDVKDLGVDLLSISSHKIYGPKGIGALYIKKGIEIDNLINGGNQEMKMRAGTENVPAIVGFGKAAELAKRNLEKHIEHLFKMRNYLGNLIYENIEDVYLNGPKKFLDTVNGRLYRHPGNLNVSFKGIDGESLALILDTYGIFVSTGSACTSGDITPSHVLSALEVEDELIHGAVRFTVGDYTTKEDIDYVVKALIDSVNSLRALNKKG